MFPTKPKTAQSISRRVFLQASAATSGGLVLGFHIVGGNKAANAQPPTKPITAPNAFLRIARDGSITVQVKHLEFGQGVLTSLPMLVAEELGCDWRDVRAALAPSSPVYAHTALGMQMTGGSSSVSNSWEQMRMVGATARAMLVSVAATKWKVTADKCRVENGVVFGPSGQRAGFGELADAASKTALPEKVVLKEAKDFTIIGKPTKRIDAPSKVNGSAQYGLDITVKQVPNLHVALVKRSPIFGGKVKSFNADKVKEIAGVTHVVQLVHGVAIVGKSFWVAKTGRDALEVVWDFDGVAKTDSAELRKAYLDIAKTPGAIAKAGNVESLKTSAKTVTAEFEFPYLAHAPMEPLNCTVRVSDDRCEIWTGTQFQTVDQGAAAQVLGIKPEQVKLNTMIAGGGFGRRANPASDYVREAVEIAKEIKVPVKTIWTREDDIRGGYYRPMVVHRVVVGLDSAAKISGWDHTIVGQSILVGTPFAQYIAKNGIDPASVEGAVDTPYDIPNMQTSLHTTKNDVPVLWWRSVGHTHTAFVMESMIDDLAKTAGQDPVEFRRTYLGKHPRVLKVLNTVAEKANWGAPLPKGRALGVAVHESFGSVCGQVAEVSVEGGKIKVHRVVAAIDCGVAVNPLTIAAQVEGAIAFGLTAALYGKVTFKDGMVEQSNFHDYPILRMAEMPRIDVHIITGGTRPRGVGEPGTPPIAPAVANAIFALTGIRLRSLPFNADELKMT
jgi:isoquinoline 1-oxidoreductase subunit beta